MATAVESVVEMTSKKLEDARIKDKATYRAFVNRIAREDELKPKETEELSNVMIRLEIDADRFRADVDVLKELAQHTATDWLALSRAANAKCVELTSQIKETEQALQKLRQEHANTQGMRSMYAANRNRIDEIKRLNPDIIELVSV